MKDVKTEAELIEIINSEITKSWELQSKPCSVQSLREENFDHRNWSVDMIDLGGNELLDANERHEAIEPILEKIANEYDVDWS